MVDNTFRTAYVYIRNEFAGIYVRPTRDIHFLTMKNILREKMPVLYHLPCHCRRTCIDPRLYFLFLMD